MGITIMWMASLINRVFAEIRAPLASIHQSDPRKESTVMVRNHAMPAEEDAAEQGTQQRYHFRCRCRARAPALGMAAESERGVPSHKSNEKVSSTSNSDGSIADLPLASAARLARVPEASRKLRELEGSGGAPHEILDAQTIESIHRVSAKYEE